MVSVVMIDSLLGGAERSTEAFERTVVGFFCLRLALLATLCRRRP